MTARLLLPADNQAGPEGTGGPVSETKSDTKNRNVRSVVKGQSRRASAAIDTAIAASEESIGQARDLHSGDTGSGHRGKELVTKTFLFAFHERPGDESPSREREERENLGPRKRSATRSASDSTVAVSKKQSNSQRHQRWVISNSTGQAQTDRTTRQGPRAGERCQKSGVKYANIQPESVHHGPRRRRAEPVTNREQPRNHRRSLPRTLPNPAANSDERSVLTWTGAERKVYPRPGAEERTAKVIIH